MTIDDVRAFDPQVVVLGVASTEPHGPSMPYGTDTFQCDALCRLAVIRANEQGARALMYPTLPIGNNVNFKPFPFACRMKVRTLMLLLLDIIEALEEDGIRKIVLVDGHGGNTDTIRAAMREHFERTPTDRRAFVCITRGQPSAEAWAAIEHASNHGGEHEACRQLHLNADLVRQDKFQDQPFGTPLTKITERPSVYYVRPWNRYVPLSGGGDTRAATADKGRAIIESAADNLAKLLLELSNTPWNPEFPYPPQ